MPNPYLTLTPEVQLRLYGLGLVRFVRTREPQKHIYEDLKMRIPDMMSLLSVTADLLET